MSGLKLRVGKTYADRHGNHYTIAAHDTATGIYTNSGGSEAWWEDGRRNRACVCESDLVAEVKTDAAVTGNDQPVPHADLIRAVLDGKVVQHRLNRRVGKTLEPDWTEWMDPENVGELVRQLTLNPANLEFRLKPEVHTFRIELSKRLFVTVEAADELNAQVIALGRDWSCCNHEQWQAAVAQIVCIEPLTEDES